MKRGKPWLRGRRGRTRNAKDLENGFSTYAGGECRVRFWRHMRQVPLVEPGKARLAGRFHTRLPYESSLFQGGRKGCSLRP